jgi:cell wall-associated NlpC family hydrolase
VRNSASRPTRVLLAVAVLPVILLADADVGVQEQVPAVPAVTAPIRDLADLRGIGTEPVAAPGGGVVEIELPAIPPPPDRSAAPGIPEVVLAAYRRAEAASATSAPGCGLTWWMLAAVGKMESDHADGGRLDAAGDALDPIFGPWLDGSGGTAAIPAPGAGPTWQRAAGPMQFLPATWAGYGNGGNPQNIDDAVAAAGRLLCAGGSNLLEPGQLATALHRYNPSASYVDAVLAWAATYAASPVTALPSAAARASAPARSDAATDAAAAAAVAFATAQLGLPYVWGGDGPDNGDAGFDCSGLAHAAYVAAGIPTPRTAQTQYDAGPLLRTDAPLRPGDLVFYGTPARVHHVGIYVGGGKMINAPTFGRPVQLAGYRRPGDDYVGATRPAARPGSLPLVLPARAQHRFGGPGSSTPQAEQLPTQNRSAPLTAAPADPAPGQPVPLVPVPPMSTGPSATTPPAVPVPAIPGSPTVLVPAIPDPTIPAPPTIPVPVVPVPVVPVPVVPVPVIPVLPTSAGPSARAVVPPAPVVPAVATPRAPIPTPVPVPTPTASVPSAKVPPPTAAVPLTPPTMTRARAIALFASSGYTAALSLTFLDAASGRVVVLTRQPSGR